jgi:hypothetical protein
MIENIDHWNDHTVDRFITITNKNNRSPYLTTWLVNSFNEFKVVASLKLGENRLCFDYKFKGSNFTETAPKLCIKVQYKLNMDIYPLNLAIIVAKDSKKTFDMDRESKLLGESNDLSSGVKRLQSAAKLWQAVTSNSLNSWGHGRKSFRLDLDANQGFLIYIIRSYIYIFFLMIKIVKYIK